MDDLQKKVQAARQQRKEGKRVEVAPVMQSGDMHERITAATGLGPDDRWMVVTVMGPEGCQLESKEMACNVLFAGSRDLCEQVFEEVHKRGNSGDEFPFELAIVRQNRWFKIPFEVGPLSEVKYHEDEMQYIWDQKAGDVDLMEGVRGAQREGVRRYFAGFK